jgi:protein TonB
MQGIVFVSFVVNKDRTLSDFRITRGIGGGCDEEVLRVLLLSPPWKPGFEYGISKNFLYTMPISFTLQNEGY